MDDDEDEVEDDDGYEDDDFHPQPEEDDVDLSASMGYEVATHSLQNSRRTMLKQRLELAQEKEALRLADKATRGGTSADNFLEILKHRHRTVVAGWRQAVDCKSYHRVGKYEFYTALRKLGCIEDGKVVWKELVGQRDTLTLADLDADSAQILSEFFREYVDKADKNILSLVEKTDSLRIDCDTLAEKIKVLKKTVDFKEDLDAKEVFKALCLEISYVTAADLEWLKQYCERGHKAKPTKSAEDLAREEAREQAHVEAARKRAVKEFRQLCHHKCGGIVAAWRKFIDVEGRGRIPSADLRNGAEKLGFTGDFDHLWEALSGEEGLVISIEDLDPAAEDALQSFKRSCVERFGSVKSAFLELMAEEKPIVTRDEFIRWCKEIRFDHGSDKKLWQYLDDTGVGKIPMDAIDPEAAQHAFGQEELQKAAAIYKELEPLPRRPPHITLVEREEQKHQRRLEEKKKKPEEVRTPHGGLVAMLNKKFGSAVRAWRIGLDIKGGSKLEKDDFLLGLSVLGFKGNKSQVWKDIGLKDNGHARLKDLDPACGEDVRKFRERCIDRFGTVHDALQRVSKSKDKKIPRVKWEEFLELAQIMNLKTPEKLWCHLDPTKRGIISTKSLEWLTNIPDTDEKALARHLANNVDIQKKKREQQMAMHATPTKDVAPNQKRKSDETRDKKKQEKEQHDLRDRLLKKLASDFKGIGRGWGRVMDPDRLGEITVDDFLSGLERLGILKEDAEEADVERAEKLFDYFDPEKTQVMTLERLDRGLTRSATNDLCNHLGWRYGSLLQAFEAQVEANLASGVPIPEEDEETEADEEAEDSGPKLSKMTIANFKYMCQEAKFTSDAHRLVAFLDPHGTGYINLAHIDEDVAQEAVDNAVERNKLKERRLRRTARHFPHMVRGEIDVGVSCGIEARDKYREGREGANQLKEFKKRCTSRYGSLQNAWQKLISPGGEQEVTFEQFSSACNILGLDALAVGAWEALGLPGTTLMLRQLDASVEADLREFYARIEERFGSTANAIDEMDADRSYEMDYTAFLAFCYQCQYRRNERRLFEYFGGDYAVKGSKIHFDSIDEEAVKKVQAKREEDDERKKQEEREQEERREIIARRQKGLPDIPTAEEQEAKARKLARIAAKEARAAKRRAKEAAVASQQIQRAGEDPGVLFRAFLIRRYGTARRAWQKLDTHQQVALTKSEFASNLRVIGYGGSANLVWNALNCKESISLKDIDPEAWKLMARFRSQCIKELGSMKQAFEDADGNMTSLDLHGFCGICESKIRCPRPWEKLFDILDIRCAGELTWEDMNFMEEDWNWQNERPLRKCAAQLSLSRSSSFPDRTTGIGHLGLCMKPRKVALPKTNSVPDILPKLRQNWNERHEIFDTLGNKTDNLIHLMTYVKVEEKLRIERRVAKKMRQQSTEEWLQYNMPVDDDESDG
jgi:Ca2+-binding EF-hand superfamily protein